MTLTLQIALTVTIALVILTAIQHFTFLHLDFNIEDIGCGDGQLFKYKWLPILTYITGFLTLLAGIVDLIILIWRL